MFVDYENLYNYIDRNATQRIRPKYAINSLLSGVLAYVKQDQEFNLQAPAAYADFTSIGSEGPEIQQSLYLAGLEPRFVPASLQTNASEIQICVDVFELLQNHHDLHAIFLITGNRLYLPLLKYCQQKNVCSYVITFQPPGLHYSEEHSNLFIHADRFLEETVHAPQKEENSVDPPIPVRQSDFTTVPEQISNVRDETAHDALGIILYHFRQFEDIYLTPVLRELSNHLGDHDDPKSLIRILNEAGAIWLEKRKGNPYNYTVLLINYDHPDVIAIVESLNYDELDNNG